METELTVVVPAYNEEYSIKETIANIKKYVPQNKIIVVDDGSTDKTKENAKNEKVLVISHPKNKGYTVALARGMLTVKTKYVGFLDADMTYNPKYIPIMMGYMKKFNLDCIWGNRFGGAKNRMPLIRKFGNRIITLIFLLITGKNVHDCASGQRILKTSVLKKLDFGTLPAGLDGITALTKRIVSRKLRYKIIPVDYEKREGASKLSIIKQGCNMIKNILVEK